MAMLAAEQLSTNQRCSKWSGRKLMLCFVQVQRMGVLHMHMSRFRDVFPDSLLPHQKPSVYGKERTMMEMKMMMSLEEIIRKEICCYPLKNFSTKVEN